MREGRSQLDLAKSSPVLFALIIDGRSLTFALEKDLESSFLEVAVDCSSVICCRSSPKQKALVSIFLLSFVQFLHSLQVISLKCKLGACLPTADMC